jgi:Fe-S cluster assembly protein SufD
MKQVFNELPRPTFRWMRVNYQELDVPDYMELPKASISERHEGPVRVRFYEGNEIPDIGDFKGTSPEALKQALEEGNVNCEISITDGEKASVWLDYSVSEEVPALAGQLHIKAGKNSELHVFTTFDGDAPQGLVNIFYYVEAGEEAKITISKVQIHGTGVRHIDQRLTRDGRGSHVKFISAEVGGRETLVYCRTDLNHDESEFKSQSMYLGSGNQLFDYSYWVPTQGCKTNTDILTTGALMGTSKKFFRGTIDFLRGGKKAVGNEEDTCLLLNKGVHSISIPLLLCKEDDVVGNHASSSGQIDQDMLFYLMSRGFSEAGARLVIVESNIRPVIDQLGDETLANKALQAVREKMQFCTQKGICDEQCTKRFPNLN